MSELVDALAARIPDRGLRTGTPVRAIDRAGESWRVVTDAEATTFDRIIVATEAHAAGRALEAVDAEAARSLMEIPYAGAATVSLGYARTEVAHALDAFGFVVPATERRALLACTFSSVKYPGRAPDGTVLLRAFVARHALGYGDATLIERVRGDLGEALGITAEPRLVRLHRHRAAMPQYVLGHLDRMDAIDRRITALPGIVLAGAGYRGLGIAECVRSGEAAAEQALAGTAAPLPTPA
jgi:oxygen-dependent protoporphyrinogen oxidase